jgi:flagellar hook-basal body complex protein FliE
MQIATLIPDTAAVTATPLASSSFGGRFGDLVDAASGVLAGADDAERAFAAHRGGLQEMVVERARADIALQIATASAQRVTQGLQTLLGMQI